jgi:tripartite ATP-independent transporter DctM subunit
MPIAFAIGISGVVFFFITPEVPLSIAVQKIVSSTQSFPLLAIPFFILAGNLMNETGITSRMIKLATVLTGHLAGGLAQVNVVLATFMGGVSGSATADSAMQARVLGPDMLKTGYSKGYVTAVIGTASLITATIPPSLGLILYGYIGEVSIGRLFAGGIVPGLLMMAALMITVTITARRRGYVGIRARRPSLTEVLVALKEGIWAIMFPIILIVGIRFGLFTPSEAGAFAAAYAIFVGAVVYKEFTWEKFVKSLGESILDIGAIMIILALSGIFGYGIVYDKVAQGLAAFITGITADPLLLMLIIIGFLVFTGMFMESTVCVLLLTPILLPIAKKAGIDPVHFGLIMMTIVTFGILTPPVGVAMYTVCSILDCPTEDYTKECIPFFIAIVALVVILILFPQLVLFVPNIIFG